MMDETMARILAGKRASRKRLAALPFAQKLELVEKMRDRSRLIASSGLRRQQSKKNSP
jgi:dGTP triphosphohydrolase